MMAELRRRRLLGSLAAWCELCLPPPLNIAQAHHRLLIDKLEQVEAGKITKLAIMMPPGSAKTTYATVLFSGWFIAREAGRSVIGVSHNAETAERNSGFTTRYLDEYGPQMGLRLENEGVKNWRTSNRGEYTAVGIGGAVTGRRADLAIIDDPVPGRQQADSEAFRDSAWNWYQSNLLTRLRPGGRVVLIMTRWHEDDLAGRALGSDPAGWTILKLPAQAGEDDPLGRAPGEYLWSGDPAYDYGSLLKAAKEGYERDGAMREWESLYQQNPRPGQGALFKTEILEHTILPVRPDKMKMVRAWDLAGTAKVGTRDPDWTVGALLGREENGRYVICDILRLRGGPDEVEAAVIATAQRDGPLIQIKLNQDPAQAGKMQALYYVRRLAGYRVEAIRETGNKSTRAAPFASQVNIGNVAMVAGWNHRALIDEMQSFPAGSHDDQIDALSSAFAALIAPPAPARTLYIPHMAR